MENIFAGTAAFGALQQQDNVAAEHAFRGALALDPKSVPVLNNLSEFHQMFHRNQPGLERLRRISEFHALLSTIDGTNLGYRE